MTLSEYVLVLEAIVLTPLALIVVVGIPAFLFLRSMNFDVWAAVATIFLVALLLGAAWLVW